ncbi:MAG: hypothetical protein CMG21_01425 [Candidatus Marinimicrobia bacterium]|nr:hypothetical protein [Candidatus Neomarinimicrobiota bacterium]|tara:strand:+ start:614 stop:928 length:315 start_codon:yes stop_codon:yes gene_type:complete
MNKYFILFLLCFVFASESDNKFNWKKNLIPIIGQIKNEKYIKAGLLSGAQFYVGNKFLIHNNKNQIAKRNTYAWWIISLYLYGVIDAYVDYSLKNFPIENKKEE